MSSTNCNVGLNLTTLATGTGQALNNSVSGFFISPSATYSQISTATNTNNAMTLPVNPIIGQVYTVRNDGNYTVNLFAGSSNSTINGVAMSVSNALIGANGGMLELIAISNNNAVSTAASGSAFNNPLVQWQVVNYSGPAPVVIIPAATAATYTVSSLQSGALFTIPAITGGANFSINIPAVTAGGGSYKFQATGTVGQILSVGLAASANIYCNIVNNVATAMTTVACAGRSSVNFLAAAVNGDYLELTSDGTRYIGKALGGATSFATSA